MRVSSGSWMKATGGLVFFLYAVSAIADAPEPTPCMVFNADYTDEGCPEDFAASGMDFCFADAVPDGSGYQSIDRGDGQIYVLGNDPDRQHDCGTVRVRETGYYSIFDSELSESCSDQMDETGYLTIHNSCNAEGWPTERNMGDRFLVMDTDNVGDGCESDADCSEDRVCREGNAHGNCCVPADPVFMGTFLLVADEPNVICIHHWCPEWEEAVNASGGYDGTNYGFVHDMDNLSNNCSSIDSIHFKIAASAIVCLEEDYIQPCSGGCVGGQCLTHPCFEAQCESYCRMNAAGAAECVDFNPCDGMVCDYGCMFGLCLQGDYARGEDADGDGYSILADCDDSNPNVHPGVDDCNDDGVDNDCDGWVDNCGVPVGSPASGSGGTGSGSGGTGTDGSSGSDTGEPGSASDASGASSGGGEEDAGCGCRVAGGSRHLIPLLLLSTLGLGLAARRRRRRR